MLTLSKTVFAISLTALLSNTLLADDVKADELQVFAAQKYHTDFAAQNDQAKTQITEQYLQIKKLGDILLTKGTLKDDTVFQVAQHQLAVEIWAQKFMQDAKVDDTAVQALYDKLKPQIEPSYKLRNIFVKTEKEASAIIKTLEKSKNTNSRIVKFKELAQKDSLDPQSRDKGGELDWIEINKVNPTIQDALKDKKVNDIVKVEVPNVGWQILLVQDIKPAHAATFDEAKPELTMFAKQQLLEVEAKKLTDLK